MAQHTIAIPPAMEGLLTQLGGDDWLLTVVRRELSREHRSRGEGRRRQYGQIYEQLDAADQAEVDALFATKRAKLEERRRRERDAPAREKIKE